MVNSDAALHFSVSCLTVCDPNAQIALPDWEFPTSVVLWSVHFPGSLGGCRNPFKSQIALSVWPNLGSSDRQPRKALVIAGREGNDQGQRLRHLGNTGSSGYRSVSSWLSLGVGVVLRVKIHGLGKHRHTKAQSRKQCLHLYLGA